MKVYEELKLLFKVIYEDQATVGKRYTRQDLIGTPYCIVIDHQTLEDDTATIRDIVTTKQKRLPLSHLKGWIQKQVGLENLLSIIK